MTAYATRAGSHGAFSWTWEVRGVNGKGLDLRLRAPDWIEGIEPAFKAALKGQVGRGTLQVSLRVTRSDGAEALKLDEAAVAQVMSALARIEDMAQTAGHALAPTKAADVLTMRGVLEGGTPDDGGPELAAAVKADIPHLIADFVAMRAQEGAALSAILTDHLAVISGLVASAQAHLPDREAAQKAQFEAGLKRLMADQREIDPDRLAQELAQIMIKSDVMEEIDRLRAHVTAASDLLQKREPVGRKLDFLAQEFNREANTLCSKSGTKELTSIGVDLKVRIDQMREQIQNVE
ncbi:YicC/YloC family endoribonuclease [Shimia ponticola]|uniref:YicC/YloC family endoribonuclease n=1 Tax=Shimia ponticola TaxID=2582893 RepID=UPI0021085A2A|nr:YicC/YloC family endoribonuclease [Shimia ponticola]